MQQCRPFSSHGSNPFKSFIAWARARAYAAVCAAAASACCCCCSCWLCLFACLLLMLLKHNKLSNTKSRERINTFQATCCCLPGSYDHPHACAIAAGTLPQFGLRCFPGGSFSSSSAQSLLELCPRSEAWPWFLDLLQSRTSRCEGSTKALISGFQCKVQETVGPEIYPH